MTIKRHLATRKHGRRSWRKVEHVKNACSMYRIHHFNNTISYTFTASPSQQYAAQHELAHSAIDAWQSCKCYLAVGAVLWSRLALFLAAMAAVVSHRANLFLSP